MTIELVINYINSLIFILQLLIYSSSFPCSGIILGTNIFYFPPFLSKTGFHHCHFPKITDSHVVQLIVSNVPIIFYIVCTIIFSWKRCHQTEHPTDPPSFLCQSSLFLCGKVTCPTMYLLVFIAPFLSYTHFFPLWFRLSCLQSINSQFCMF